MIGRAVREMMKIEILEKKITKKLIKLQTEVGTEKKIIPVPQVSILIYNLMGEDIEGIDLIWKLFDDKTGLLLDNNLNSERKEFSIPAKCNYNYDFLTAKLIPKCEKYRMEIRVKYRAGDIKVIDNINEVQVSIEDTKGIQFKKID